MEYKRITIGETILDISYELDGNNYKTIFDVELVNPDGSLVNLIDIIDAYYSDCNRKHCSFYDTIREELDNEYVNKLIKNL